MDRDLESSLIAGNPVKFIYLDPAGNEKKDSEFIARCHFIPSVGDRVQIGAGPQIAFVKRVYHSFVLNEQFEKDLFFQAVTVVLTSDEPLREHVSH